MKKWDVIPNRREAAVRNLLSGPIPTVFIAKPRELLPNTKASLAQSLNLSSFFLPTPRNPLSPNRINFRATPNGFPPNLIK